MYLTKAQRKDFQCFSSTTTSYCVNIKGWGRKPPLNAWPSRLQAALREKPSCYHDRCGHMGSEVLWKTEHLTQPTCSLKLLHKKEEKHAGCVYMSSSCLWGFSGDTPASSHSPETCLRLTGDCKFSIGVNVCLCDRLETCPGSPNHSWDWLQCPVTFNRKRA